MPAQVDQLRVPTEIHERAKLLWIATGLGGLCGFVVFAFIWKLDGQERSRWFRRQLYQSAIVGGLGWLGYPLVGAGFILHLVVSLLAFTALDKGRDYELPFIGRHLP